MSGDLTVQILREIRDEIRTTNSRLASFEAKTDARFQSIDARFDSMDRRFESLEATTATRFESLERTLVAGFSIVKDSLDGIRAVAIERHLDLDRRITALERVDK